MYIAKWNDTILAKSDKTIEVEGHRYFPSDSVHMEYLKESGFKTTCAWKGTASYYHINANGSTNENAAWTYKHPSLAASGIQGYVAFWKGVDIKHGSYYEKLMNSKKDATTGAFNSGYFNELAEKTIELTKDSLRQISLALLDIDCMKSTNDAYGHAAGDLVLKTFSERMRKEVREGDLMGRYGGDEFIVLFPGSGKDIIYQKISRIRKAMEEEPVVYEHHSIPLSFSYGVAEFGPDGQNYRQLVENAVKAMNIDKKTHKTCNS